MDLNKDNLEQTTENKYIRKVRSFVKRDGRITPSQQNALDNLLPQFGINLSDGLLDFETLFDLSSKTILEIGFGMGQSLVQQAKQHPELNFIGIEVHRPGVGSILKQINEENLSNIRVSLDDAIEVLTHQITDSSLDGLQLYFPDPWHKKKHHKRRIVNQKFVDLIASKLKTDGFFHLATDWENYAEQMLEVLSGSEHFINQSESGDYIPRPESRPLTKFEKRGHRLGHGVWDLMFLRQ